MSDICLLLEGTYPYVAGGVSTWVHDLIKEMPEVSFSILYLGPHRYAAKKMHYDMPDNVTDFNEHYIFDYEASPTLKLPSLRKKKAFAAVKDFLVSMKKGDTAAFNRLADIMGMDGGKALGLDDLVYSYEAWKILEAIYAKEAKNVSFIDYFWSWRFIYLPFFSLLRLNLPEARLYHAVSTGYAGVLGALAKHRRMRPFILTEHGIYTRERKIEISQADWIYSENARDLKVTEERDFFKEWWIDFFSFFSRLAYDRADSIITLFEGNRAVQIEEGAPEEKTRVIPNGVDIKALSALGRNREKKDVFRVGFMGRIVPIKDVKTFIRACRIIYSELKNVEFYIMGPTDEDKEYYRECTLLTQMQGLEDVVHFTGKVNVKDYYPKIDVIVLTSISEGQPLVVLEAGACGIPSVATDVGSCKELLHGSSPDDRLLGPSGIITPMYNPEKTAEAVIRLARDRGLYDRMSKVGKMRVARYYQMDNVIAGYRALYARRMSEVRWRE